VVAICVGPRPVELMIQSSAELLHQYGITLRIGRDGRADNLGHSNVTPHFRPRAQVARRDHRENAWSDAGLGTNSNGSSGNGCRLISSEWRTLDGFSTRFSQSAGGCAASFTPAGFFVEQVPVVGKCGR